MSDKPLPNSEIILYQTEDGRTRVQCRFENETLWLTQALIGELFEKDVRTINEHLINIFDEGELRREATIRKFRIVRTEGKRQVAREIDYYNLDAISFGGSTRALACCLWRPRRRLASWVIGRGFRRGRRKRHAGAHVLPLNAWLLLNDFHKSSCAAVYPPIH
jgi:hypothetical protein